MRVVEYQPQTNFPAYRALQALGIGAAALSLAVAVLMTANWIVLKRADPVHSAALVKMLEELKARPQDQALREEIRELDLLARGAYFQSQHFTRVGSHLLLGSVVVAIVSFKALGSYRQRYPYPNPTLPKEDLAENARWARRAVSTAGLMLAGFALTLALPWNSPLDRTTTQEPSVSSVTPLAKESPAPIATAASEEFLKNWPSFRGAAGGRAASAHLPIAWDGASGHGVVWKAEIPRPGFSSPIVWNDRVFVTGGDEEAREVYCFSVENGTLLWRHAVRGVPNGPAELPDVNEETGFASPTMATDGKRVFAIFATAEVVALDFDGKQLWAKALALPENPFGHASSLLVFEQTLFVQMDDPKKGALYALNAETGELRWTRERKLTSWSSPALVEYEGRPQLILSASPAVIAYDPRSGDQLWRVDCMAQGDVATAPVAANGLLYVAGDNGALVAIDLQTQKTAWETNDLIPSVSTPVVVREWLVYGLPDGGIVCRNARTGAEIWHEETEVGFYASPLIAGDRVYLLGRDGLMHILIPGQKFNLVGRCTLGEETSSSPAAAGNSLFIRSPGKLYRIGT